MTILRRHSRAATFKDRYPEWADMAYEVLFRYRGKEPYDIQYAVAQALMVAYAMGAAGRKPPRVHGREYRRYEVPPPDPELDEIFAEMRQLAWSPLAGTDPPEGRLKWVLQRKRIVVPAPEQTKSVLKRRRR
jgi:hypothetical protein